MNQCQTLVLVYFCQFFLLAVNPTEREKWSHTKIPLHPLGGLLLKTKQKITSVGEGVEKLEALYAAVRNVK